ncbi:MAG: hypothetical protein AAFX95_19955 [Cyanobacteria bacterium J06639_16]
MSLLSLLIGSSTALGMGYFCVDVYRNRHRLSKQQEPKVDLSCYELGLVPDSSDLQVVGQAGHAIGDASSECMSGGVGHYLEAIGHLIAHH